MNTFRGLHIDENRQITIREVPLTPLADDQVRVRAEFASIKHGTEFNNLRRDSVFDRERYDGKLQLFVPREEGENPPYFAAGFAGNTAVGTVTEVGASVSRFRPGDRVFGYAPACEIVTRSERDLRLLEPPLTETDVVCIDPAVYGFAAVRDARVCLGDNVVLFGLGAIGLLTVALLRRAGCLGIVAVDPIARRRALAETFGATRTLDPTAVDVATEVRSVLGQGADIAIEASGSYRALNTAMRSVRKCGRVVTLGYYQGRDTELELGKEWFHNRLEMICSLPAWGNPMRDHPLWTEGRLYEAVTDMFVRRWLDSTALVDPIVDFDDSAEVFLRLFHDPGDAIKLGIRFPKGDVGS
ncbi:MAG: zinc-binding alcohol dehydrogenase [Capsulimonadales bacterium]|nr:zinc-binding alcohol dehydrogenase [Capsulimonadales bacterium]